MTNRMDVIPAIQKAIEHPGPFLIDFIVEPEENVYPMVPPGASLAEILELPKKERVISSKSTFKVSNV